MEIAGYTDVRPLGEGGMATVWLARQASLGREVVLKVLKPHLARDPMATERFLREARIAAGLHHPNIVAIHDVGVHAGVPYIAMAHEPGGTLADLEIATSPGQVLPWLRDIALALDYAHRQGVVHRDVKPHNILRRADGAAVLSDFGIARAMQPGAALTQEGTSVGTPHYMSPEQLRGDPVDGRSDLYSLGVTLHELLTGRLPYGGTDGWAIGMQHLSAPLPQLPPGLARYQPLVEALMAKDPAQRPADGAEVVRRIDRLLAQGSGPTQVMDSPRPAPIAALAAEPAIGRPGPGLLDILRNPGRAAETLGPGTPWLLRPWPLTLLLALFTVLMQVAAPMPVNSLWGLMALDRMPWVAELFDNERVDAIALRATIARVEVVAYSALMAAMGVLTAAGLALVDRQRPFRQYVAIVLYAINATSLWMLLLQLPAHVLTPGFRHFQILFAVPLYGYYVYALAWTYRNQRMLAVAQVVMLLVANSLAQLVLVPPALLGMVGYVRFAYRDHVTEAGNADIYVADLGRGSGGTELRRPGVLTHTLGLNVRPSFLASGDLVVSTSPDTAKADLVLWEPRSGSARVLTETPDVAETGAWPLAGGGRIELRDGVFWRVDRAGTSQRLSPLEERFRDFGVAPDGTILAITDGERRGYLIRNAETAPALVEGARGLGIQVQWRPGARAFTVLRRRDQATELVQVDAASGRLSVVAPTPNCWGGHAWIAADRFLLSCGAKLVEYDSRGKVLAQLDLSGQRVAGIGRLAVSPRGDLIAFERHRKTSVGEWLQAIAEATPYQSGNVKLLREHGFAPP